jgi:Carboxypeptidase regulatory-like domain
MLWPAQAAAQAVSGTILGSVNDGSGAAVASVKITLTHAQTGLTRVIVSDSQGEYVAPSLPPGLYNISAEAPGFKKLAITNVQLNVDQKARVDLTLEVGATTESVNIEGSTPLVQTESSDLSGTVNEKQIKNLPLNGRDFVQLTRTLPGVMRGIPGANIDGAGSLAWRASASFSANGMRTRDNNFLLDGVDNNETWLNSVVIFPSIDALEEFKVQTSTYSAEFGRSSGGVVNIQIKSGQNALHGSAFEFLRNDALDANDFFNNKNGRAKPPFKQNQFGGTLGGPIRRDKMFFFGDYQGGRIRDSKTYLSTVPTLKMRDGDFSELNRTIYDPLTGKPFTGNALNRVDPVAKAIVDQLYPTPNVAGTKASNGQIINNFLYNPVLAREDDQFDAKIDNYLSQNNHFFGRYSFERTHRFLPATLPHGDSGTTFGAGTGLIRAQSLALNDTHTFSPRWLNEARIGFSRIAFKVTSIDGGTNLAKTVGIPGVNIFDTATEVSYVGSKGTHLVIKQDINQAPPVVGVSDSNVNRPFIKLAPGLRALSQVQSRGDSNHHALLTKFSNRFSNGLAFVNSYTFGKTIDFVSDTEGATQNAYDFARDRAVSDFDVKHTFTSSWTYDLPFGKGKLIGGGVNSLADKFIGGWQLSGILLLRSGLPFTVNQSQNLLSTGTGNRPNRIASGKLDNPTIDRWFDLNAFVVTADNTGTYGNSGRNILRAPGQANVDFSLVKVTRFRERFEHQLKFEFFNAFNHAQFAAPGNTIGNASAGVISSLLFGATARQIQVAMKLSF